MSSDSRQPKPARSLSLPPPAELGDIDTSWDDDTAPGLELDDPMSESAFDRVTAIPELPAEVFAKQVMSEQPSAPNAAAQPPEPRERLPSIASEPPLVSVRPLDPMGMQEPPAPSQSPVPGSDVPAGPTSVTARPGARRNPLSGEPTGLELMEPTPSSPETLRRPSTELAHDPRDPVLELDLGEVARSGPPPPLLVPSQPESSREAEITEMKDRYAMGDFTGALVVAESMLEQDPGDIDAERYARSCRDVLTQMYTARLGALSQRVTVAVPGDQIRWLSLDHRAGFVLSLIDGSSTVEELLDISGMNRLDALRILYTLFDQRVIALG